MSEKLHVFKVSQRSQVVRCRLSAWLMTGLSISWAAVSFVALRWLFSITNWRSYGPMDWLCVLLLLVHAALILATLWIWRHPLPELLVMSAREDTNRLFPAGFLVGLAGIWFAARWDGWLFALALIVSALGFFTGAVGLSREIRAERKLEQHILKEQHDTSS